MKKVAVEIVQGLTGTKEGINTLSNKADSLSSPLIDIIKCEEVLNELNEMMRCMALFIFLHIIFIVLHSVLGTIKTCN